MTGLRIQGRCVIYICITYVQMQIQRAWYICLGHVYIHTHTHVHSYMTAPRIQSHDATLICMTCMHIIFMCVYVHTYTYGMNVYIYAHKYTHSYISGPCIRFHCTIPTCRTYGLTCMYTCTNVCTCIYVCTYVYVSTRTYIYIYIHSFMTGPHIRGHDAIPQNPQRPLRFVTLLPVVAACCSMLLHVAACCNDHEAIPHNPQRPLKFVVFFFVQHCNTPQHAATRC